MAGPSRKSFPPISRRETTVSLVLLSLLVVVGAAVYAKQFSYDPALFSAQEATQAATAGGTATPATQALVQGVALASLVPATAQPMGPPEEFGADNLSDKIDGKAELYLESGFKRLVCQRFILKDTDDLWFELYAYDMGAPLNAFAVFSNQRRSDGVDSDVARFAYATGASLFLAHGAIYAEIVSSDSGARLTAAADATATALAATMPGGDADASELGLLPADGLLPRTVNLMLSDAFGYDKFSNVLAADYAIDGTTTTAFLSVRKDAAEAAALAEGYHAMLTTGMGADNVQIAMPGIDGLRAADMLGDTEIVFAVGPVVAGVHTAKSRAAAEKLAAMLHQTIREKTP